MEISAITVEISKLTLKPDDLLVIRFPKELERDDVKYAADLIRRKVPFDTPILFLHGDIELTIVSKDDPSPAQ